MSMCVPLSGVPAAQVREAGPAVAAAVPAGNIDRATPRAAAAADRYVYRQVHMGMQVRLALHAGAEATARAAANAAFAEIARLDAVFSDYRDDSEISELARAGGTPHEASAEMLALLTRAEELAQRSGGAFDVTAGPLTTLWRAAIAGSRLPSVAEIAAARARTGHERVRIDAAAGTVTLAPGTRLDVGGIAKGYILDRALATLRAHGVAAALLQAGGDIVVGAAPPASAGWRIEVPHLRCVVTVADAAVATSGDAYQFVVIDGTRYSHTVDPRSGRGVTDGRTATVIAPQGLTADGLATALTVLAADEAAGLLAAFPEARALLAPADCG